MRVRILLSGTVLALVVFGGGSAAWAHSEFDPPSVTAGEVADLTLTVENEQPDSGTVKIDLFFPEGQQLTVVAVPEIDGWTATVKDGSIGSEASGIVWERASASSTEDPVVSMQLGPIPTGVEQLQFKVLQTYANGEIDRWIQEWPAGQPEPDAPGPVLQVGANPSATTVATTSSPSTTAPAASPAPTTAAATTSNDDDSDSNTGLIVAIAAAVVLVGGGSAAWVIRRRRA